MLALSASCLLLLAQGQDCPHCQVRDGRETLCSSHAAEERRVLTAERNRLRMATDAAERIDALGKIAQLTARHKNVPSPKVAETLALGFADDSFAVRLEALRLLEKGQHEAIASGALIAAAPGIGELWSDMKLPPGCEQANLDDPRQFKKVQAELEKRGADTGELLQRQQYYENLVAALARSHDPKAEEAVLAMKHGAVTMPVVEAVADIGSRRSTERIVEWLAASERRVASDPGDGDSKATAQRIGARLSELARLHGLPEPKGTGTDRPSKLWREWLRAHGSALPAAAGHSPGG